VTKSSAATDLIPAVQSVSDGKEFVSKLTRGGHG
jgi:hypothetical protein